jgi:RND superfamily putative drug exporter
MLVIFDADPHGAAAIDRLDQLAGRMPALLDDAELGDARVGYSGETAIARESIDRLEGDSGRVAAVVLAVNLLLLMVYLRAVVAPFLLVAASALAVLAALGLTALAAGWLFDTDQLTYFIPFTAGVLLVSLGSDYNVYVAGRVWQEAGRRPLPEAVAVAAPRAARAIRSAGLTLAGSFALLAIVPVLAFREFAIAMVLGVLLETFVVRSLLVPGLVALVGYRSGWPGRRLRRGAERRRVAAGTAPADERQ